MEVIYIKREVDRSDLEYDEEECCSTMNGPPNMDQNVNSIPFEDSTKEFGCRNYKNEPNLESMDVNETTNMDCIYIKEEAVIIKEENLDFIEFDNIEKGSLDDSLDKDSHTCEDTRLYGAKKLLEMECRKEQKSGHFDTDSQLGFQQLKRCCCIDDKCNVNVVNNNHKKNLFNYKSNVLSCSKEPSNLSDTSISEKYPKDDKPHKCNECSYSTARKADLKRHVKCHTGEKSFKCNDCNYSTSRKDYLNLHVRSHTGENPYKCDLCNFRTSNTSNLKCHIRSHTGEKPFKCNECSYSAIRNADLIRHVRCHTGEKPFKCKYCEYGATQKSHLTDHLRGHTGEKPFVCSFCDFRTARKSNLALHNARRHTGEKPIKCSDCDYRASRNSELKHHRRIHTDDCNG